MADGEGRIANGKTGDGANPLRLTRSEIANL
jgi:hypothetical protein